MMTADSSPAASTWLAKPLMPETNHSGPCSSTPPEFEIARWAADHLTPQQRAETVVFTSGEHCPMCSAAHAWVGLGRIVYASSSQQLSAWHKEWGLAPGPVLPLPVQDVAPGIEVAGPDPELSTQVRNLHARLHEVDA